MKMVMSLAMITTLAACGDANNSKIASSENSEIASCSQLIAEPTAATIYGYDIRVTRNQLSVQPLSLNALVQAKISDIEETHWSTQPATGLEFSCVKELPKHETVEINVYKDVVVVQKTGLNALYAPKVFKILASGA
ncbi:MAG: hypothetical protein M3Q07_12745 [Pseudobdellovibrionaceae bacterium]|nr:hypothetical protein [Pseudobdellovibrionaceae bacterium]